MRLFVAVFPPAQAVADLRRVLDGGLTLTAVERWHLTLVFLGEVTAGRVDEVRAALESVSAASAGLPDPVGPAGELRLAGGGKFENGRSSAVWAGLAGNVSAVTRLHDELRTALAGFPLDERPFRPHLTVAYAPGGQVPVALEGYAGPPWRLSEFVLVRSRFDEGGGYERLGCWDWQP